MSRRFELDIEIVDPPSESTELDVPPISSLKAESLRVILLQYLSERWQRVYQNNHGALVVPNFNRTACFVEPSDTKDGRVRVDIRAPILVGVPRSAKLFEMVAMNATNWNFGALSVYEDEENGLTLEFDYAILADGLTAATLNYLVDLIATTADDLAPKLQKISGGRFLL